MPKGLELEYFIYTCTDEVYNEEEIKRKKIKEVVLRKCFKEHELYVQRMLNQED